MEEPGTSMITGLYIPFWFLAIPHYNKHNWSSAGSGCFYIARFTVAGILEIGRIEKQFHILLLPLLAVPCPSRYLL